MTTGNHPALEKLKGLKPRFQDMNLKRVRVFGSVARGDAGPNSDIDLLVDFYDEPDLFELGSLQIDLEEHLGCKVDLVFSDRIFPDLKDKILSEARDV